MDFLMLHLCILGSDAFANKFNNEYYYIKAYVKYCGTVVCRAGH